MFGIFIFPYVFVWFLLRKGHSNTARAIGFSWLAFLIFYPAFMGAEDSAKTATPSVSSSAPTVQRKPSPVLNYSSYKEVDDAVGCNSKFSDEKKKDIFNSRYKHKYFIWSGEIALLESDEASLNIDGFGTQDLRVEFANEKAGYDLTKGERIKVKFRLTSPGGCFLPFGGDNAEIVN